MSIQKSLDLLERLAREHGLNRPYIVGGVPRDQQLEGTHELADIDITTGDEDVHKLARLFAEEVGKDPIWQNDHYMVSHNDVRYDFAKHEPHPEIDAFLKEKGIEEPSEMLKEVYSRDFTINTLMMPTDQSDVVDLTGTAIKDIKNKLIRCPINCDISFVHDPKRMLRAYYFRTKYDFEFSDDVRESIVKNKHLLAGLNRRYAAEMINKIVREEPEILGELIDDGILQHVPITKYLNKLLIEKKRILDVMEPKTAGAPLLRKNLDYGEGLQKLLDEHREEEDDADDGKNIINPIETAEFCESPSNKKYWKEMGDDPAAKDFQDYAKKVKCKSLPVLNKEANIRGPGVRECPFGLPISVACKNAGNSVDQMSAITSPDKTKQGKQRKANRRVYAFHQTGERCVYADKIVHNKDRVHCDWGEAGQRMEDFPLRPSPFYPRVFHGLGQYGLYPYPVNEYTDSHGARQLFTGIFSLYASTGEIMIQKTASFKPDVVLEKLVSDLAIKDK